MLPRSSTPRNCRPEVGADPCLPTLRSSPLHNLPLPLGLEPEPGAVPLGDAASRSGGCSSCGYYENRPHHFSSLGDLGGSHSLSDRPSSQPPTQVKAKVPGGTFFRCSSATCLHSRLRPLYLLLPLPGCPYLTPYKTGSFSNFRSQLNIKSFERRP